MAIAAPCRDTEVTRQIARLEDDPRTAALRLTLLTHSECATGVLGVAHSEGHLRSVAVVGALAETVVLEATAGGAETVEVVGKGFAAAGVVFGLVGDLAFDADGLEGVDGGSGAGLCVAIGEESAGGVEAAIGTGGYFGGGGATRVERVGCSIRIGWRRGSGSGVEECRSER